MSIITDALKKAERDKGETISSKEYTDRMLGPERKEIYRREVPQNEEGPEEAINVTRRSRVLAISGTLIIAAIIFLTITNLYLIPSSVDVKIAVPPKETFESVEVPITAEAYSDVSPEISMIEQKLIPERFKLNGIVWDTRDSWAIVNNKIVRTGDTLDGARIVSIEPKRVVLTYKGEEFNLVVK